MLFQNCQDILKLCGDCSVQSEILQPEISCCYCSPDEAERIFSFKIVVPPLPGKALKRQLPFRGDEGIFDESFIEERRVGLEQFINRYDVIQL